MANGLESGDSLSGSDTFKFFRGERASSSPGERWVRITDLVTYLNSSSVLTAFSSGGGGGTLASIDNTDSPYTVASGVDYVEVDASSADVTITLPAISGTAPREITFMRSDSSATNSITISGDANISGLGSKVMSVKNVPEGGEYLDYDTDTGATRTWFYDVSSFASGAVIVRAVWVQMPISGTSSLSFVSATPNASNWDVTVHETYADTDHNQNEWFRLQLTTPVTIANTDKFGVSVYSGDADQLAYTGPSARPNDYSLYWMTTGYSASATNQPMVNSNAGANAGILAEIEAVGTNDVFKLVAGSSAWYETIA